MAIDDNTSYELTGAQVKDLASRINAKEDSADLAAVAESGSYNDLLNKPTIGNATLTIQKNGTSAGIFTANATSDKTINITVPTTAADVSALPASTKYGASIAVSINTTDYKVTTTLKDQDGNTLGTAQVIDLPLESVVVNGSYDSANKKIVLTLQNGNTIDIPVGDLVAGLQTEITAQNMLDADLVDDSTSTNKFTTVADISKLAGIATGAEVNVQSDWNVSDNTSDAFIKNKPTIPTVNNATLTIQKNGTTVNTFTANASSNVTANIAVPTKTSDITNDSGFITEEDVYEEVCETGKTIAFQDAAPSPLASFQLDGETSQNGTPTPDAPVAVQTVTGENVVKICGKNLLDIKNNLKASDGGLNFSYSNDKLVVSGTPTRSYANVTNEINTFLAAGQYTLSLSEAVSHRVYIWIRYTDGTAASLGIINAGGTSATTTFAKDVAQIRLDFSVITTGVALSESFSVQLEKGSSSSSFEPYQEQSYTISLGSIELCKIGDYQDYIYKSGDKWYVRKEIGKVAVDSSYYSTRYGTNSYGLTQFLINLSFEDYFDSANIANMLSNSFDKQSTSFANTQVQGFLPALDPSLHRLRAWVRINTTTADTEAQFKTWLDNNRPIFYYKLDTPTDTEITNEALVAQLEAILSQGYTYAGTNNITTVISAGNAQGTLEICYTNTILPYATKDKPGIVQIGDGLSVDSNGVISSDGLTSVDWDDIDNKPTNVSYWTNDAGYITAASLPTVNNATLTIQKNGTTVNTFTANSSNNVTANIPVPTLSTTDTDPGEGSALAADTFLGVYDIAPTEIDGSRITNSTVTTNKLANGAVTAAKVDFSTFGVAATVNGPSSTTSKSNGAAWASTDMYTGSVTLAAGTYLVVVTGSSVAFSAGGEQEWFNITVDSTIVMTGSLAWLTDSVVGGNGVGIATVGTSGTHTVAYQLGAQGSRTCTLYSGSKIQFIRIG